MNNIDEFEIEIAEEKSANAEEIRRTDEKVAGEGINWKQKLSSRKLWAAVISAVLMCVSAIFGDEISPEMAEILKTAVYAMIAYIFGESAVDIVRLFGEAKVEAAKELSNIKIDGTEDV